MTFYSSFMPPPPIVRQHSEIQICRCRCPECIRLDGQHPDEGYQLTFLQYRVSLKPASMVEVA